MNREQSLTQAEIIQMAREAGFVEYELDDGTTNAFDIRYERFAKLVAEHSANVEREACAKVCENIYTGEEGCGDWPTPEMCAEAIRARGDDK